MNVSREEKMAEALKRMRHLGLFAPYIKSFKKEEKVQVSEPPMGALYYLEPEEQAMVEKFEQENDALVYLVVRSFTNLGKMDALLYVSDSPEEWEMDWEDLKTSGPAYHHLALAYVVNHDMPDCSEFGTVALKRTVAAGLLRVFS